MFNKMASNEQVYRQVAKKRCPRTCSVELEKINISPPRKKQKKYTRFMFYGCSSPSVVSSSSTTLPDYYPQKKHSSDFLSGYKIPKKKALTSNSSSMKKTTKNNTCSECSSEDSDAPSTLCVPSTSKELSPCKQSSDTKSKSVIISRDITNEREILPIPVINEVDNTKPPDDFFYVTHSRANEVYYLDSNTVVYCECKDNCFSNTCPCGKDSVKCWYDKDGKLINKFFQLKIMPLIFECNRYCHCGLKSCKNRVVQKGIQYQLQLFKTPHMGWGVRTVHMIEKGSFVCEYVGELVTDKEANHCNDNYLFDLEKNKDRDAFCLDGTTYGNISRFVNHFCNPNLIPIRVFVEHQDLKCPRIALFAIKNIKPFEQLGFDYGEKFWSIKNRYFSCKCGSSKCKYPTISSSSSSSDVD